MREIFNNLIQNMKWHQIERRSWEKGRPRERKRDIEMKQSHSHDATQQRSAVECLYKLYDCRGLALKSHNTVNMCTPQNDLWSD